MNPLAILALALSMSADAFAAAIGRGAAHRPSSLQAIRAGLVFGSIEAVTPLLGWAAGSAASGYVEAIDHWIAFALLLLVGGHMIRQALATNDAAAPRPRNGGPLALVATAIGTSIDAAAVGVSLAFLDVDIWIVAAAIGLSTFLLTSIGMRIGSAVGARLGRHAELLGGIALIAIGALILVEHLGLLASVF